MLAADVIAAGVTSNIKIVVVNAGHIASLAIEPAVDNAVKPVLDGALERVGNHQEHDGANYKHDSNPNHLGNVLITAVVSEMSTDCLKHVAYSPFLPCGYFAAGIYDYCGVAEPQRQQ
jgi:hypothetical protein